MADKNEKIHAVEKVIQSLDDLDASLSKEVIDAPPIMADKVNNLVTSLNGLLARATGDFSEQFEVPKSLLEHLDQIDANNPELYKTKRIKEAIQSTEKFNEKLQYLENMKSILVEEVEKLHAGKS